MACYLAFLHGDARHVRADLPEIRHTFHRLFATVHLADKAVKNLNLAGVVLFVQLMDQDAVNQLMDVFISKLVDLRVPVYDVKEPLYICAALRNGIDLLFQQV